MFARLDGLRPTSPARMIAVFSGILILLTGTPGIAASIKGDCDRRMQETLRELHRKFDELEKNVGRVIRGKLPSGLAVPSLGCTRQLITFGLQDKAGLFREHQNIVDAWNLRDCVKLQIFELQKTCFCASKGQEYSRTGFNTMDYLRNKAKQSFGVKYKDTEFTKLLEEEFIRYLEEHADHPILVRAKNLRNKAKNLRNHAIPNKFIRNWIDKAEEAKACFDKRTLQELETVARTLDDLELSSPSLAPTDLITPARPARPSRPAPGVTPAPQPATKSASPPQVDPYSSSGGLSVPQITFDSPSAVPPRVPSSQAPGRVAALAVRPYQPSPNNPQSTITGTNLGQDIRSYDSKQGTIVAGDGRTISIKPMVTAIQKVSPIAAESIFVPTANGGLRLSPDVQRTITEQDSQLRKVGGVELDVTFQDLSRSGVPEMRTPGPATLIENPVLISLKQLVSASKAYAGSPEQWRSLPDNIRFPGSIGRVHGYVLDPETRNVFIVGTSTSRREARLDIDLMIVLMDVVWAKGLTPGVSLDPSPYKSSAPNVPMPISAKPGEGTRTPISLHGEPTRVLDWAGPQNVRIINLPSDALVSKVLLDADYEMKRINFGLTKISDSTFKSEIEITKGEKFLKNSSFRFWFHPIPLNSNSVRVSSSGRVVLFDAAVQLLTESLTVAGVGMGESDPLAERAAAEFTRAYRKIEASPAVNPPGIFALLHGTTDIVTLCKILREAEIDYPVLDDLRRLPFRHLTGSEAIPSSYRGLTVNFQSADGQDVLWSGGVHLQSRPTRRSYDRFEDEVGAAFERATVNPPANTFLQRLSLTFTLVTQQPGTTGVAELAKQAGQRLLTAGRNAEAAERLRDATSKNSGDIDAWVLLSIAEAKLGRFQQARSAMEQAQAIDPNDFTMQKAAVQIALLEKTVIDFDKVDPVIRRELSNDYVQAAFSTLGQALDKRDTRANAEAVDTALRLWPDNADAYFARGLIRNSQSEEDAAVQDFSRVIRLKPDGASAYVLRGISYHGKGANDLAIKDLDRAIELDPNDSRAFKGRADAHLGLGDYRLSMLDYDRAIQLNASDPSAYTGRGTLNHVQQFFDAAIRDYSEAIKLNPRDKFAFNFRGKAFIAKDDYVRALLDFDQAIRIDPKFSFSYVNRGMTYYLQGDRERAIYQYGEAIRIRPASPEAFFVRGHTFLEMGDLDRAVQDYNEAVRLLPTSAVFLAARADAFRKKLDFNRAILDYDRALQIDPRNARTYDARGLAYVETKSIDRALLDFNRAIELDPKSSDAFDHRGIVFGMNGDLDRALQEFSKAIELDPRNASAFSNRSIAYGRKGNVKESIDDLNEVIRIDPKRIGAFYNRAEAYFGMKEYDRAIADYTQIVSLDPGAARAFASRCNALVAKRDRERALEDCNEAIRIDPKNELSLHTRGGIFQDKREFDRAISDFSEALRIDPGQTMVYYRRGNAYFNKKDFDRAIEDFGQAIRANPRFEAAYMDRGTSYFFKKDYDKALADLDEAIRLDPRSTQAFHNRGSVFLEKRTYDRALADYNEAIRLDPKYASAYLKRGYLKEILGSGQDAVADWNAALAIDPNLQAAKDAINRAGAQPPVVAAIRPALPLPQAQDLDQGVAAMRRGDAATAMGIFRKAADAGNARAQFVLGDLYSKGQSVPHDPATAASWYRKAAEQGLASAQLNLAGMYAEGEGVPQDLEAAIGWLRKAADQSDAAAQYQLGIMYGNGRGVPQDVTTGASWIRKAAEQGDAQAQYGLGGLYLEGQGVPRNVETGVSWFRKSADQGYARAQLTMGKMYDAGQNVPQDQAGAVNWYRKAAEAGLGDAQYSLGLSYQSGQGVAQSYVAAASWYQKAAEQGIPGAQFNLGIIMGVGQGVPQDRVAAYKWLILAAAGRAKYAGNALDLLAQKMTQDEIAEAQRLARDWKPRQPTPSQKADAR